MSTFFKVTVEKIEDEIQEGGYIKTLSRYDIYQQSFDTLDLSLVIKAANGFIFIEEDMKESISLGDCSGEVCMEEDTITEDNTNEAHDGTD